MGLGTIVIKCVGVFVMVGAIGRLQTAILWSVEASESTLIVKLLPWVTALAQLLVGLALVLWGGRIAGRWSDDSPSVSPPAARVVLRLALLVAGVVLIALAIPGFCQSAAYGVLESWSDDGFRATTRLSWHWIDWLRAGVYPLVELVVGVLLVAFSERLSRLLWRDAPAAVPEQGLLESAPQELAAPDEA
jgi:hypothetical protein